MKTQKSMRVLEIFMKLLEGKYVNKIYEACKYQVSERTIQRDIDTIRDFFSERLIEGKDNRIVAYSKRKQGYFLKYNTAKEE